MSRMSEHRVYPSLAELGRMAATAHYAPIYREVLADVETPVTALLKLGAGPGSFLLESVEGGEFVARYSFVAAGLERSLAIYDDRAIYSGGEGSAEQERDEELRRWRLRAALSRPACDTCTRLRMSPASGIRSASRRSTK